MKRIAMAFLSITFPFTTTIIGAVFAASKTQASTEKGFYYIEQKEVDRAEVLKDFLEKYNSPLAESAETFVEAADRYDMDYRILPAISCMESTCGRFLIPDSHNPFGWGVYGNGSYIAFASYDDAIQGVAEGLNEIYFSRGLDTPEEIAPVYTPPNHGNWLWGVNFFMEEIDQVALNM